MDSKNFVVIWTSSSWMPFSQLRFRILERQFPESVSETTFGQEYYARSSHTEAGTTLDTDLAVYS